MCLFISYLYSIYSVTNYLTEFIAKQPIARTEKYISDILLDTYVLSRKVDITEDSKFDLEKVKHRVFLRHIFPSLHNFLGRENLNLIFVIIVKSNFLVSKPFGKGETKTN